MPIMRWANPSEFCLCIDNLPVICSIRPRPPPGCLGRTLLELCLKKTKKICDEILTRYGDGEYLKYICTGKGEFPDQSTFWRWRQKDRDLAQRFMLALVQNVTALLEKSELLIEAAVSRDEILKADKMLNHYRWKAEKLTPAMQSTNKAMLEVQGAVRAYSVRWAEDAVALCQQEIATGALHYLKPRQKRTKNTQK